jgi:hypothetical protein
MVSSHIQGSLQNWIQSSPHVALHARLSVHHRIVSRTIPCNTTVFSVFRTLHATPYPRLSMLHRIVSRTIPCNTILYPRLSVQHCILVSWCNTRLYPKPFSHKIKCSIVASSSSAANQSADAVMSQGFGKLSFYILGNATWSVTD